MFNFLTRQKSATPSDRMEIFSFGDPEPVLDNVDLLANYLQPWHNGQYWEVPVNLDGLYKSQFANTHHASAMALKVNLLCDLFQPSRQLSLTEFRKFAMNAITFGNAYLEEIPSRGTAPLAYRALPTLATRRIDETRYGLLQPGTFDLKPFEPGQVIHYMEHDLSQEYYGKPYYLACLQPAWLNEEATLFRRKYFKNGNHAGFILYLSDPAHNVEDVKALKTAMKESKGPGAFRNLFMYAPKGKKDGIQVIPVESAQAQDKFFDIKNISRDDVMAMHRIPPNMMAVQSTNSGGFGNITDARAAMILNEIVPLAKLMQAMHPALQFDLPGKDLVQ